MKEEQCGAAAELEAMKTIYSSTPFQLAETLEAKPLVPEP
jgi:hypothetical protein